MIRRVTAIAVWALLLHLNLVASDLVCAKHHESVDRGAVPAMQHHGATHSVHISDAPATGGAPCDVPTRSDCCRAMMSCAVSFGVMTAISQQDAPQRRSAIDDFGAQRPMSPTQTPETPPPKA